REDIVEDVAETIERDVEEVVEETMPREQVEAVEQQIAPSRDEQRVVEDEIEEVEDLVEETVEDRVEESVDEMHMRLAEFLQSLEEWNSQVEDGVYREMENGEFKGLKIVASHNSRNFVRARVSQQLQTLLTQHSLIPEGSSFNMHGLMGNPAPDGEGGFRGTFTFGSEYFIGSLNVSQ
ncbi:MAG: hypothetical protein ACOCUR_03160, partial [Nanoarchaeota archaeon]